MTSALKLASSSAVIDSFIGTVSFRLTVACPVARLTRFGGQAKNGEPINTSHESVRKKNRGIELKMKLLVLAVMGTAVLSMQACSVAPVSTPQGAAENANSTLNVYDDNRVAYQASFRHSLGYWAWTSDKNQILALLIQGHEYNARDIAALTSTEDGPTGYRIAVQLKSGESISSTVKRGSPNAAWLACNTQKVCAGRFIIGGDSYTNDLDGILIGIYDGVLNAQPKRDPKFELIRDYRVIPDVTSGLSHVRFLSGSEQTALEKSLDDQQERWAQAQAELAKRRDEQRTEDQAAERAIERDSVAMRQHIRVGTQTNCGQVFEVRLPMVGVQTINGMQFIDVSRLYSPNTTCRFVNGQYVGR